MEELKCSIVSCGLSDGPALVLTMRWSLSETWKSSADCRWVVAPSPCHTKLFSSLRGGQGHAGTWSWSLDFLKAGTAT